MSSAAVRPKRAAEDYARTHDEDGFTDQPSKKPRFDIRNPSALAPDAIEDDATLDADVIGGRGRQIRRNAVNIDGYDSDSENEGFDARVEAKARKQQAKSQEEEENDMFADLADDFRDGDNSEGDQDRKGGKKKAVRFLEEDEIEGQIQNSKSGGHVSANFTLNGHGARRGEARSIDNEDMESSSESEVGDEIRASTSNEIDEEVGAGGKKVHAPKLDAFNMRNEQEEGRFDDQGNYVRKAADPDAVHDTWLEGLSKKDMRKAKEAANKRDQERRKRDLQDDAITTCDILKNLIPLLDRGETVLEALARLGKGGKKPKWQMKTKAKKQHDILHDTNTQALDLADSKRREAIERITEAADLLLTRSQPEIYEAEREMLTRQYQRESGEVWVDPPKPEDDKSDPDMSFETWEYRWSNAGDGGEIYGPYDGTTMAQWNAAGYFGDGVEFRRVGADGQWSRAADFL